MSSATSFASRRLRRPIDEIRGSYQVDGMNGVASEPVPVFVY